QFLEFFDFVLVICSKNNNVVHWFISLYKGLGDCVLQVNFIRDKSNIVLRNQQQKYVVHE
ncbi:MAG: hypothetical protein D3916_15050, partial [Candidatus Electrothrix sp. MAN1_4]|nr:hypothetical protein [Candidatus Electrothrix sp. MAN1_4]